MSTRGTPPDEQRDIGGRRVTYLDGGLSPEAIAFRDAYVDDRSPTDFTKMAEVRRSYLDDGAAASDRAIDRHDLVLSDVTVGGIDCTHIVSRSGGTSNGAMLYVFGGAFIVGSPIADLPVIGAFAEQCRVEVIAPKYRLAPEYPAPAASDDCLAAWRGLVDSDPTRVVLAGESAGGNLALLTAQRAAKEGLRLPDAMALLSPAVDLRADADLFEPVGDADPTLSLQRVRDVGHAYLADREPADPSVSPLFGSMEALPSTIITTGTRDLLLPMCTRLARKMRRTGVDVECVVWDGLWHVFEFYDEYPESAESLSEIADFLNKH